MEIYIINLKRSPERKEKLENQIKQHASSNKFTFFEAIDAKQGQHIQWKSHQTKLAKLLRGLPLSAGETACFASHYSLWQLCANTKKPIVIMEDDAVLQPNFDSALKQIANSNYNYVKFKAINNKKQFELEQNFTITYLGIAGALGYYLTPAAADRLIAAAKKWSKPIDDYLDSFWLHGLPTILYSPALVGYPAEDIPTIDDRRAKVKFIFKLSREFCRGLLEIRKFLFLRLHKLDAKTKMF